MWGGLIVGLLNLGRATALWRQGDWLTGLSFSPDPRLRLAAAVVWALLFFLASVGLWRRRPWTRWFIPLLLALNGVYELGMIVIHTSSFPAVLPIVAYIAFLGFAGWALWRPSAAAYFQQKGDR
jgi:hypothetical protein